MSAEYLMKSYIQKEGIDDIIHISSAGTEANPQEAHPTTVKRLQYYKSNPSNHRLRKVSKEILEQQDLIICMGNNHKQIIENMGFDCILFNKLAYNKDTDVPDIEEFLTPWYTEEQKSDYIIKVIDYLHNAIPLLAEHVIKK